jgi:MFS family permease
MKWIEGWYLSYALLGLSAAGLLPILLPLVMGRTSGAAYIGLVMSAFSMGGLTAPIWGAFADRFRLHRWLLMGGLIGTAAGAAVFPLSLSLAVRIALAFVSGIGLAAASTTANLFIVEVRPQTEWDARIGWLQTFYGGGQVIGLGLAGFMGQAAPEKGLWLAGVMAVAAIIPALSGTRRDAALLLQHRPVLSHSPHHAEWPVGSPQHLYHHLSLGELRRALASVESPFGLFLVAWLLSFSGTAAFFSLYPVLMQQLFGILPGRSSAGYAIAAGLGLILYAPAGKWSAVRGPLPVLREALVLRVAAFLALTLLAIAPLPGRDWLAMMFFLVVVLAWSLLSVSSTALIAALSPENEGEGMGIFNAVTAFSGVVGAALGGWAASLWGYVAVPVMGIVGAGSGLLLLITTSMLSKSKATAH